MNKKEIVLNLKKQMKEKNPQGHKGEKELKKMKID